MIRHSYDRYRYVTHRRSLVTCPRRMRLMRTLIQPCRFGDDLRGRREWTSPARAEALADMLRTSMAQTAEQQGDYVYRTYPTATRTWVEDGVLRCEPIDIYAAT